MKVEEGTDWSGEPCREEKRERFGGPANCDWAVFLDPDPTGSQEPVQ